MDYPKSVANVGLVDGKFVDEDTASGTVGSLIPAEWGNAVTDEILNVIKSAGLTPDESNAGQLLAAITKNTKGRLVSAKLITTNGLYTPTAGTKLVEVDIVGGGGGGGGCAATAAGQYASSSGGGGGAYAKSLYTIDQIGASQAITIGAGGAGGVSSGSGGNGGTTTFGSLMSAPGGVGGGGCLPVSTSSTSISIPGGSPGTATGGNLLNSNGIYGTSGIASPVNGSFGGPGGGSPLFGGGGGAQQAGNGPTVGYPATAPGAGGGGISTGTPGAAGVSKNGGAGASGAVLIREYA